MRTLALPDAVAQWSLTSLREKLIKIGAKIVRHGRYVTFQMAEVVIPRDLFADIRDGKLAGFGVRVLPSGRKRFFVHCQHRGERSGRSSAMPAPWMSARHGSAPSRCLPLAESFRRRRSCSARRWRKLAPSPTRPATRSSAREVSLVNRHLTAAQRADFRNHEPGDIVVFHSPVPPLRVEEGDPCRIVRAEGEFVFLEHPSRRTVALKAFRRRVRQWGLQRRSDKGLLDLARMFHREIAGWISYFSVFYKSALYPTLGLIDAHLHRWVMRKFKRFRQRPKRARLWLARIMKAQPTLFAHWPLLHGYGRALGAV